jgi:iron(II)-dependent oxidoreductase
MYSWGNAEPDCEKANYGDETCVRTKDTTPVGQYPSGVSPYGVLDMAGNVWEWTSTLDKPYPYDAQDGREDPQSSGDRVMRGGSWNTGAWLIRTSARYRNHPDYSSKKLGFRCAR